MYKKMTITELEKAAVNKGIDIKALKAKYTHEGIYRMRVTMALKKVDGTTAKTPKKAPTAKAPKKSMTVRDYIEKYKINLLEVEVLDKSINDTAWRPDDIKDYYGAKIVDEDIDIDPVEGYKRIILTVNGK